MKRAGAAMQALYLPLPLLRKDFHHPLLNDSKQVSQKLREQLRMVIEKESISFAVAHVTNHEIDEINILQASFKAMHLALDQLTKSPQLLLVNTATVLNLIKIFRTIVL